MDLGADGVQTFRLVTFPALRSALLAGAGVQTLPIWLAQRLCEGTVRGAGAGAVAAR
jgi:ABC-type Fe3+ transport system permease subunit